MTFLPIIARELRVRARSRAVYWTRFAVVLAGMVACLPQLIWSAPFVAATTMGRGVFDGLMITAFLLSCGACLLTSDVISSERREGTLGLLLLTRVKAFDVLVGKLGSAGLTSLCALVAFLPLLMIPVLAGGVTGAEVFRKGLVLLDTLFLALAAGLWASAGGREWLKTARDAGIAVTSVVLGPCLLDLFWNSTRAPAAMLGLLSPLGTIFAAGDASYKGSAAAYWISLLLVHALGWALLLGTGSRLRNGWREDRGEIAAPEPASVEAPEPVAMPAPRSPLTDDANPIAWRLQRQCGIQALLWAGALASLFQFGAYPILLHFLGLGSYSSVAWPLSLAISALEGALFAWAASRFFVEARRTGELELLLTTPYGAREIVSTQWEVLKRRLRWPMLVMLLPAFLEAGYALLSIQPRFPQSSSYMLPLAISRLICCVDILFGIGALCWVGLWFGLKAGRQAQAVVWTVSLVKGLPYLISILCSILFSVLVKWAGGRSSLSFWIMMSLPQVVILVLYLGLIRLARQRLVGELAGAEVMRFDLWQFISSATRDAVLAFHKARHWTPS